MNAPSIIVIFRNDDVSALSDLSHERRVADIFKRFNAPQTIGVVPFCTLNDTHHTLGKGFKALEENPSIVDFLKEIRSRDGTEIALHGYTHQTSRLSNPGKREYFEFREISLEEQTDLLAKGVEKLQQALGFRPVTFIPPWNRLDESTVRACRANAFSVVSAGPYTPSADGIISFGTNCDLFSFPMLLEAARKSCDLTFLHILFHSKTTRSPEEMAALESALKLASSEARCHIMTVKDAAERYANQLREVNEAGKNIEHQSEIRNSIRARGYLYYRSINRVFPGNRLSQLYRSAKEQFFCFNYKSCIRIGFDIDAQLKRVIFFFKSLVGLGSFAFTSVLALIIKRLGIVPQGLSFAAWLIILIIICVTATKSATSPDTKQEIRSLTYLAIIGSMCGFSLPHLLP